MKALPHDSSQVVLMDIGLPGMDGVGCVLECEVLDLLAKGASYKEIADHLKIAPRTLISHIKNIYQKLRVHSRADARHLTVMKTSRVLTRVHVKTMNPKPGMLLLALLTSLVIARPIALVAAPLPRLKVSDNQRFLTTESGQPFFWLGDTAWELFHRLNREEAERYLKHRAAQGFTVIQAVVLAEFDGLKTPNAYGHRPLEGDDPTNPNEDYFKHVDWIVAKANSLGLYIGMLPTWGNNWYSTNGIFTPQNAEVYGEWLARRYRDAGLVWILGGDRRVRNDTHRKVLRAMARGLRKGDDAGHLKTFHPRGGSSSSMWFHNDDWLDFNMAQTGHSPRSTNYWAVEQDYARVPAKPCMDGEPAYEYPPGAMPENRPVGALQVRRNAYWALFAGAHGHTYGTHPIWQMYAPPRKPLWEVKTQWYNALDLPGAIQLSHLKALMLSRPFLSRIPDQDLVALGQGGKLARIQATRDGTWGRSDASYLMTYFPEHRGATINTEKLAGSELCGWWFNPRTGKATALGTMPNQKRMSFEPPTNIPGEDWVLVLDDASMNYPAPGALASLRSGANQNTGAHDAVASPYPSSPVISGFTIEPARQSIGRGDNWAITWASDDKQYSFFTDGRGFGLKDMVSSAPAVIEGCPPDIKGQDIPTASGTIPLPDGKKNKKVSGVVMIKKVLYAWVRNLNLPGAPQGTGSTLMFSRNFGKDWSFVEWNFPNIGYPCWLNAGKNYGAAQDECAYFIAPDGPSAYADYPDLLMGRVPVDSILDKTRYQFFHGCDQSHQATWGAYERRRPVFHDPAGCFRADIVYNPGLRRYFLMMSSPYGEWRWWANQNPTRKAHFGLFDAPNPWGPWTTVTYLCDWGKPENRFAPHIPPKWISDDGVSFYLLYSCIPNGPYRFNIQKCSVERR